MFVFNSDDKKNIESNLSLITKIWIYIVFNVDKIKNLITHLHLEIKNEKNNVLMITIHQYYHSVTILRGCCIFYILFLSIIILLFSIILCDFVNL